MTTRAGTLLVIGDELLSSGVLCLTGGHDLANTPLLTFPASTQSQLQVWTSEQLEKLLRHYVTWLSVTSHVHTVACLADLQHASKDVINVFVEALEKVELSCRGTVSALYLLKPQNKTRSKQLKKLLGLKPSKKHPKIPLFKVLLMKTYQELFSQVDLCHLTSDFGGTLDYDHMAWMKLDETVSPCVRRLTTVLGKVPDLTDRVELLHDYETRDCSVTDLQALLTQLTQSYQLTVSEAHFQEILDRSKQVLLLLDNTQSGERWLTRLHDTHVQHARECVRTLYTQLAAKQWELEDLWKRIEANVTLHLHIQRHRERAAEIEKRVTSHYEPLLTEHPCVGGTLSQAELYRTHFATTLYEPAKELLSQATEILEDVQRLRERATPPCDVTDILRQLTVALQPFTLRLQGLQDIYVAVHIFHLLFQKAATWYRKVLKFLPEGLEERAGETAGVKILQMPVEWQAAVASFLTKHPPPRQQHLVRLDTHIPPQVEKPLRVQARALALRLRLLQRLLYSRRIPVKLLSTIFKWKAEAGSNGNIGSASHDRDRDRDRDRDKDRDRERDKDRNRDKTRAKAATLHGEPLTRKQNPLPPPPPKPARLLDTMRSFSSFSSSDAGDLDYADMSVFDRTDFSLQDVSADEEDSFNDNDDDKETRRADGVLRYQEPPRLDIKIAGARDAGSGQKEEPQRGAKSEQDQSWEEVENAEYERFIRLTLSPGAETPSGGHRHHDDSLDSEDNLFRFPDVATRRDEFPDVATGSESGIEVMETEAPWDSLIDRIKAVSNSTLPSDVKLQCMSHLLSTSKVTDQSPSQRGGQGHYSPQHHSNTAASVPSHAARSDFRQFQRHIDLAQDPDVRRHRSFAIAGHDVRSTHRDQVTSDSGSELPSRASWDRGGGGEGRDRWEAGRGTPAHAVARMRHRLARSLLDLHVLGHHDPDSRDPSFRASIAQRTQLQSRGLRHAQPRGDHHATDDDAEYQFPQTGARYFRQLEDDLNSERYWRSGPVARSYAGHLNTAHLPPRGRNRHDTPAANPLTTSHDAGFHMVHHPDRYRHDSPPTNPLTKYHEAGLHMVHHPDRYRHDSPATNPLTKYHEAGLHMVHHTDRYRHDSPATNPLTKSHEAGLHTAHLPAQSQQAPSTPSSWRSREGGLDGSKQDTQPIQTNHSPVSRHVAQRPQSSGQGGAADHLMTSERAVPQSLRGGAKSPYRWRQGIVGDSARPMPPSPTPRPHHKSNEFISPSFLKPYRSMNSLHLDPDASSDLDLASSVSHPPDFAPSFSPGLDRDGKVAGSDPEGQTECQGRDLQTELGFKGQDCDSQEDDCDSLSEALHQDYRRPSLERMSDEVEQEYLSQDEVESSLKRSQRILMEAEEQLNDQSGTISETDDSTAPTPGSQSDQHTGSQTPATHTHTPLPAHQDLGEYESIHIHITNDAANDNIKEAHNNDYDDGDGDGDEGWDDSTVASELQEHTRVTSRGLMGDAEWDADVSNMSDAYSEIRQQD
ncbi:uncharacterized protein [Littorina saxatilis]|uniref:uncharacterized protein n=1 Tax=Littorina saxatilis TaxID=31220 RepID=UPI0038B4C03E